MENHIFFCILHILAWNFVLRRIDEKIGQTIYFPSILILEASMMIAEDKPITREGQ